MRRRAGETPGGPDWQEAAALVAAKAGGARAAGIDPTSPEAARIVDEIAPAFAGPHGDPQDSAWRRDLAGRLAQGTDARAERYWQLLAIINGWPPVPTTVPAREWLIAALRAAPSATPATTRRRPWCAPCPPPRR